MNKKFMLIVVFVVIGALIVSAFSWAAITRFNESQRALADDLTSLDAAEASAYRYTAMAKFYAMASDLTSLDADEVSVYRWNAIAKFYESHRALTGDLTPLNAVDASAYRWEAMAKFYARQASTAVNLSWPSRPDFSYLIEKADIPITGSVAGLAVYQRSEWAAPAAIQSSMDLYHQSERSAAQVTAFHFSPPGK